MDYLFPFLIGLEFFALVFVRIFTVFCFAPLFSNSSFPIRARAIFGIAVAVVCVSFLELEIFFQPSGNLFQFAFYLVGEVTVGFCIGFALVVFFSIYQLSAQFFSFQIGFGISSVFDPISQVQVPITGQLQSLIGFLIFISLGGLQATINAVIDSYYAFGIGGFHTIVDAFPGFLARGFYDAFRISAQIALPIMTTLFIITASLGLLARFAPQMNLLMIGFPIYILVGVLFLVMYAPIFVDITGGVIKDVFGSLFMLFKSVGG